jgi:hypothetical protein
VSGARFGNSATGRRMDFGLVSWTVCSGWYLGQLALKEYRLVLC